MMLSIAIFSLLRASRLLVESVNALILLRARAAATHYYRHAASLFLAKYWQSN